MPVTLLLPDQVLLDVGAGAGYFSLAAAARGHRAIAVELSSASLASFEASIAYNGFGKLITLHKVRRRGQVLRRHASLSRSSVTCPCHEGYWMVRKHVWLSA